MSRNQQPPNISTASSQQGTTNATQRIKDKRGNTSISNYKLLRTIGRGHYSKVKLAQDKTSGQFLAIKIIKRHHVECISLPTFKKILNNEVRLLEQIRHPNIIQLVDYNCEGELVVKPSGKAIQIFFIVLELIEQGDLFSFIKQKNRTGGFSERFARFYFRQMLDAIEYLHIKAGVVHRDLKPENLLLDRNYQLKIADFGLSARCSGDKGTGIHYSTVGTRQYQAPEVLEKRSYRGERVDIFSMGVILFTMVTGVMPYFTEASVNDPLYQLIIHKKPVEYWQCWQAIKDQAMNCQLENDLLEEFQQQQDATFAEELLLAFKKCLKSLWKSLLNLFRIIFALFMILISCRKPDNLLADLSLGLQNKVENKVDESQLSQEFKSLVFQMMAFDHHKRPTLAQIRQHPWLTLHQEEDMGQLKRDLDQEMSRLRSALIVHSLREQPWTTNEKIDGKQSGNMNMQEVFALPKSFKDYVNFLYQNQSTKSEFFYVATVVFWRLASKKFMSLFGSNAQNAQKGPKTDKIVQKLQNEPILQQFGDSEPLFANQSAVVLEKQQEQPSLLINNEDSETQEGKIQGVANPQSPRITVQNVEPESALIKPLENTEEVSSEENCDEIGTGLVNKDRKSPDFLSNLPKLNLLGLQVEKTNSNTLKNRRDSLQSHSIGHSPLVANKQKNNSPLINLLKLGNNRESSCISSWLDDQIEKESRNRRKSFEFGEISPNKMIRTKFLDQLDSDQFSPSKFCKN